MESLLLEDIWSLLVSVSFMSKEFFVLLNNLQLYSAQHANSMTFCPAPTCDLYDFLKAVIAPTRIFLGS